MKRKPGRPKKEILKECPCRTSLTKSEYFVVREKASKAGLKLAAYIRVMAINGKIEARLSDEQWVYMRRLVDMSKDLNRLADNVRQEGSLQLALHFEAYRDKIDEILKLLKHAD